MEHWSADQAESIFASGASWFPRSAPSDYAQLAADINDGRLKAVRFEYEPAPEPDWDWESKRANPDAQYEAWLTCWGGSGGERHGRLKWWAWNWLASQGEPAALFEQPYVKGTADLIAPVLRYVIECGDTSPERVLPTLQTGRYAAFVVIPYPYFDDQLGRIDYSGWIFRLGPAGALHE